MPKVTYTPLENGDSLETSFGGINFKAHQPVEVPPTATILQMVRVETKNAEGLPRATAHEKAVPIVEALKTNPYFSIEGSEQPKRKAGRPTLPKTAAEYRAFALGWFKTSDSPEVLAERWDHEQDLRDKLGVIDDGDDFRFLRPFFDARMNELKKAA